MYLSNKLYLQNYTHTFNYLSSGQIAFKEDFVYSIAGIVFDSQLQIIGRFQYLDQSIKIFGNDKKGINMLIQDILNELKNMGYEI